MSSYQVRVLALIRVDGARDPEDAQAIAREEVEEMGLTVLHVEEPTPIAPTRPWGSVEE